MTHPWDDRFEDLLRDAVPALKEVTLTPDLDLVAHGLDSMAIVELLVRVEDVYGARLSDAALGFRTFGTPGSLWAAVSALDARPAAPGD